MNLAWVSGEINDSDEAVILHEFGHALGLTHEHRGGIALDDDGEYASISHLNTN